MAVYPGSLPIERRDARRPLSWAERETRGISSKREQAEVRSSRSRPTANGELEASLETVNRCRVSSDRERFATNLDELGVERKKREGRPPLNDDRRRSSGLRVSSGFLGTFEAASSRKIHAAPSKMRAIVMNLAIHDSHPKTSRPGLYRPSDAHRNIAQWHINGYPAAIFIWTQEEWDRLADRPDDAQYYPCGVWCALRLY